MKNSEYGSWLGVITAAVLPSSRPIGVLLLRLLPGIGAGAILLVVHLANPARQQGESVTRAARVAIVVVAVVVVGATLAACAPRFPPHSSLKARVTGRLVTLSWTAAHADPKKHVAAYGIEVNGTEVARAAGSGTSCVLSGLAGGAKYDLTVVAYDNAGRKSRSWNKWAPTFAGVSTTAYVPAVGAPAGPGFVCAPTTDQDDDRLPDAFETGNGTFVDVHSTGTDATNRDTDDDGVNDGDEVLGTSGGLDLYRVGARPTKQDLLVEFDWFDDSNDCAAHSHRPTPELMDQMKKDFAAVPVPNPNGSTGINLIADVGQGGGLTGGNLVPDADGIISGGVGGPDYVAIKTANFRPERAGYFHYVLMPHRHNPGSPETGQAYGPGVDAVVSLWICGLSTASKSNIILHELGHNLGLDHGGADEINFKPNYNSVMNYRYLFYGTDTNCDGVGDQGVSVFSNGSLAPIDENALSEPTGLCNGVPIDWNGDGQIQPGPVKVDLTPWSFGTPPDGFFDVLTDYDDISHLCLRCVELYQPSASTARTRQQAAPPIVADSAFG